MLVAIPAAAIAFSAALHGAFSVERPPAWTVAALAVVAIVAETAALPLPQIHRRVIPANGTLSHVSYGFVFGSALGAGVITRIASAGFFVLLAWAIAASNWSSVFPVAVAFGVARTAPIALVAATTRRTFTAHRLMRLLASLRRWLRVPEIALLALVAAQLLIDPSSGG